MSDTAIHATPARILYPHTPADEERWMEIVTGSRAMDPTIFSDRLPVFWPTEMSSNRLDSYFSRMGISTLRNFAQGANDGVAFQNSHRWMELPLGQSVEGVFVEEGDLARMLAVWYTLPDLNINGVDTSQFINAMRAGIVRDVSVGFYGGRFICDLCGRDMLRDMECPHWPGFEYDIKDGDVTRTVLATVTIEDGLLSEGSAVFDGATPGAGVLKAQREAEAGRLNIHQVRMLEARYRVRLYEPKYGGVTVPGVQEETNEVALTDATDQIAKLLADAEAKLMPDVLAGQKARSILLSVGAVGDGVVEMATWAVEQIRSLRPLADAGRAYRADLTAETLAEGVRGMGAQFTPELYRTLLENATLEQIKGLRDQWRAMGDARFPGGALVRNSNEPPKPEQEDDPAPDLAARAYR